MFSLNQDRCSFHNTDLDPVRNDFTVTSSQGFSGLLWKRPKQTVPLKRKCSLLVEKNWEEKFKPSFCLNLLQMVLSGYKNIENKISTLVERTENLPCVSYCNVRGNYCKWRLMWRSGFNLLFKLALLKQSLITLYRLLMLNYKCELQQENIQRSFFHLNNTVDELEYS